MLQASYQSSTKSEKEWRRVGVGLREKLFFTSKGYEKIRETIKNPPYRVIIVLNLKIIITIIIQ